MLYSQPKHNSIMSSRVTLGGDRLGSGKKMKVDLHGYGRSNHDLSYIWRSTQSAGTLVPFMSLLGLPGDTFDIDLECVVKTHPTIGPLFGSYKVQLDVFQAPIRLYQALLHNNALKIGLKMSQVKLPQLRLEAVPTPEVTEDIDNSQVNPSCILAYLGIRGIGITPEASGPQTRDFNAIPYLAYWDTYKNYYANKQEEIGAVIHTPKGAVTETVTDLIIGGSIPQAPTTAFNVAPYGTTINVQFNTTAPNPEDIYIYTLEWGWLALSQISSGLQQFAADNLAGIFDNSTYGTITVVNWRYRTADDNFQGTPKVQTFPLEQIDMMREELLAYNNKTASFVVNDANLAPYNFLLGNNDTLAQNLLSTQEGLGIKTYQSDLFNNWLNSEYIDGPNGVNDLTAISTTGDKFTIDALNFSKKIYEYLTRITVSGGTYNDWLEATYDQDNRWQAETPIYHGGLIKELTFQEVVSNSESADGQPLGTLAGKGVMADKHKGGKVVIKVSEPSYILGIVSLTPRVDYSQGNQWDVRLQTMDDLHKPALDEIGFQDLIEEDMAWWSTRWNGAQGIWQKFAVGKQPAWLNYMTNINKVYGNFAIASNEMFMTLNRRYEWGEADGIKDLTTYIDPVKFNFIFAETALDAQNFWTQIRVGINARRVMSNRVMPNL